MLSLLGFEKAILGTVRNKKAERILEALCKAEVTNK